MKKTKMMMFAVCTTSALLCFAGQKTPTEGAKLYRYSTTIEKERPQLDEVTKGLIAAYHHDPSEANRAALEKQVRINYEKVLAKKKAKLEELKRTAGQDKIKEMEDIVNEMIAGRETRIQQSMARFTDKRMRPNARAEKNGYHVVLGAANVSAAHTPVTVGEYAQFCKETGREEPKCREASVFVTNVSLDEAKAYCDWLTKKVDGSVTYRLPTAEEWELAAGHMPKDADFDTITGACGAIDFWGKVWQMTSTMDGENILVKGGASDTSRLRCRTEIRDEVRATDKGYANVGFRVFAVSK